MTNQDAQYIQLKGSHNPFPDVVPYNDNTKQLYLIYPIRIRYWETVDRIVLTRQGLHTHTHLTRNRTKLDIPQHRLAKLEHLIR